MSHMNSAAQFNIQVGDELTWNVMPLLHEIKHALKKLIDNNETNVIDLRSIPLAPGEEQKILDSLGCGEVHARLNALGPSEIIESQYPGVWVITHYNEENEIVSRFIEVTTMPDILLSQKEDVIESLNRLSESLDEDQKQ